MNRILLLLTAFLLVLSACDTTDKPSERVENTDEKKTEEKVEETPKTPEVTPPAETQSAPLTPEDLATYYGWDSSMTIPAIRQLLEAHHGVKSRGADTVEITEVELTDADDRTGSCVFHIKKCLINGRPHTQTIVLTGFAVRPSDHEVGTRSYARWAVPVEKVIATFELDPLLTGEATGRYDTKYMSDFVTLISSDVSGRPYTFTAEDLKDTQILSVRYDRRNASVAFKIKYKGFVSTSEASLPLSVSDYYSYRIRMDEDFARTKYMRGVYENLGMYYSQLISYDRAKYAVLLVEGDKHKSDGTNSLSFDLLVMDRKTDRELARVTKSLDAFKPLSRLSDDLGVAPTATLSGELRKRLKKGYAQGDDVTAQLKGSIHSWAKHLQFVYGHDSYRLESTRDGEVIAPQASLTVENGDLYLHRPRFELVSAVISDTKLRAKIKLIYANEVGLDDVAFDFIAHGFH